MSKITASRPTWDEYFLQLAELVSTRSTCTRRQVGAVIVRNRRLLTTGYNGSPKDYEHCLDIGCLRDQLKIASGQRQEMCRAIHAEQNAILQAAQYGISIENSSLYCTHQPCSICARLILNVGIERVIIKQSYPDALALELFKEGGFRFTENSGYGVFTK